MPEISDRAESSSNSNQMFIEIDNYPVFVRLGWFESERKTGQEIVVSIKAKLAKLPEKDSLADTIDYAELLSTIDATLQDQEIYLLETAVRILSEGILASFAGLTEIETVIEKRILPGAIAKGGTIKVRHQLTR